MIDLFVCFTVDEDEEPENGVGELYSENSEDLLSDTDVLNCSDDLFESAADNHSSTVNIIKDIESDKKTAVREIVQTSRNPVRVSPRLRLKIGQANWTSVSKHSTEVHKSSGKDNLLSNSATVNSVSHTSNIKPVGHVVGGNESEVNTSQDDDTWSDDELFEEDSFIVKATQIPEDLKTFSSPVFTTSKRKSTNIVDEPKTKYSRTTFQLGSDSNSKTTTCTNQKPFTCLEQKVQPITSTGLSAFSLNKKTNTTVTSNSKSSFPVSTSAITVLSKPVTQPSTFNPTNKVNNNSGFYNTGFRPYSSTGVAPSNVVKSHNFKKHNSFSGPVSQNQKNSTTNARKRSLSGDFREQDLLEKSGSNKTCINNANQKTQQTPACGTYFIPATTRQSNVNSAVTCVVAPRPPVRPVYSKTTTGCVSSTVSASRNYTSKAVNNTYKTVSSYTLGNVRPGASSNHTRKTKAETPVKNGDFDTSLSDDLLCQLAEPDEVLDSQICAAVTTTSAGITTLTSTITTKANLSGKSNCVQTNKSILVSSSAVVPPKPIASNSKKPVPTRQFRFGQKSSSGIVHGKGNTTLAQIPAVIAGPVSKQTAKIQPGNSTIKTCFIHNS